MACNGEDNHIRVCPELWIVNSFDLGVIRNSMINEAGWLHTFWTSVGTLHGCLVTNTSPKIIELAPPGADWIG